MDGKEFKAFVEGVGEFSIRSEEIRNFDLVSLSGNDFHLIADGQSLKAHLLEVDFEKKEFLIRLKGKKFRVSIADQYDRLVKRMGLSETGAKKVRNIKAPMPGLVLDVLTAEGEKVEEGTPLLILEAMKMENIIKSAGNGVVKNILVNKGAAVEKSQLLIELE